MTSGSIGWSSETSAKITLSVKLSLSIRGGQCYLQCGGDVYRWRTSTTLRDAFPAFPRGRTPQNLLRESWRPAGMDAFRGRFV